MSINSKPQPRKNERRLMFYTPEIGEGYPIEPLNEDKRIRVFGSQLMDAVIDDLTLTNYNRLGGWYIGQGIKLIDKFPDKEIELSRAIVTYWRRSQIKFNQLKGE